MGKKIWSRPLFITLSIFIFLRLNLLSQTIDKFFDTAGLAHTRPRLVIFYPSQGTIQDLLGLKNQGFLPLDKFEIIGVYYEKEHTDYEKVKVYARENNLTWLKFHKITAELEENSLFQINPCTQEFENIFKKSDGMIFFGGPDIPPPIYKNKTNLLSQVTDPFRHYMELSFIFHLLGGSQDKSFMAFLDSRPDFPILGICLGSQSLNVGSGGTLVQDIWSDIYDKEYFEDVIRLGQNNWHTNPYFGFHPEVKDLLPYMMHPIQLLEKGKFCAELGFKTSDNPFILSAHHQQAGRLGKGFRTTATSLDGKVVEAIEHEKFPNVLGVQFHPEFNELWDIEKKFKFIPQDRELVSLITFLQSHSPSFKFHKKIWAWFSEKLEDSHKKTQNPKSEP